MPAQGCEAILGIYNQRNPSLKGMRKNDSINLSLTGKMRGRYYYPGVAPQPWADLRISFGEKNRKYSITNIVHRIRPSNPHMITERGRAASKSNNLLPVIGVQ